MLILRNADSPLFEDGKTLFVKPYETEMPFPEALERIQQQEEDGVGPILYAQTRPSPSHPTFN
jgi:hypothetical protein